MSKIVLFLVFLTSVSPLQVLKEKNELLKEASEGGSPTIAEEIIETMIDFEVMAKNSMGKNLQKCTPQQKNRFFKLFEELLKKSSLKKLSSYQADRVDFLKEEIVDENTGKVWTKVWKGREETDVIYLMKKDKNGEWKVIDIIINELSITKNYNSQFTSIINKEGVEGLLKKMEKKIKEE